MRALVFGVPRDAGEDVGPPRDDLDRKIDGLPFGMHQVDDARLVRPDWVITRPRLSGVCGSESKLVLGDFTSGDVDNPMAAFSSIPHIPGHEVVAEVVELGPKATGLEVGQRVLLNPWLTCGPRGIDPPCPPCQRGELNLCWSFTEGALGPGVHVGVASDAPGGWADLMAAHDSMLIPIPDGVSDEVAVLGDPFAVSLHAILRCPPPPGGRVLVYGAGALGVTSVAILRSLYPDVEVAVVARFPAQAELAMRFHATLVLPHEPRLELVEALADWSGGVLHTAFAGLPMAHPGGIDVVYDTVARPETLEVGVRLLAERGTLVQTGVHTPGRWEYTPIYFKELSIVGSNAFGVEEIDGVRQHALRHYLDLVQSGRVDLSGMLTHRFPLDHWHDALRALSTQEDSGAVKVAFEPATTG
jgi:threonine dehydrogenase-like Zn-dependent dehydrogenase